MSRPFIQELRQAREDGFGFVPLVGAGLSALSGIPIMRELREYLGRCVARAFGLDLPEAWRPECSRREAHANPCRVDLHDLRRWLPGRDDWPRFGDCQVYERDPVDWFERLDCVLREMRDTVRREGKDACPELNVLREASGASADWR